MCARRPMQSPLHVFSHFDMPCSRRLRFASWRAYVQQCSVPEQSTIRGMMIVLDLFFNSILGHKPIFAFLNLPNVDYVRYRDAITPYRVHFCWIFSIKHSFFKSKKWLVLSKSYIEKSIFFIHHFMKDNNRQFWRHEELKNLTSLWGTVTLALLWHWRPGPGDLQSWTLSHTPAGHWTADNWRTTGSCWVANYGFVCIELLLLMMMSFTLNILATWDFQALCRSWNLVWFDLIFDDEFFVGDIGLCPCCIVSSY